MSWLFRPTTLVIVSLALAGVAFALVVPPWLEEARIGRPTPLPVKDDEREIVWLYSATSAANWERFVTGLDKAAGRLRESQPDLECHIDESAFPPQTAAVPQVKVSLHGGAQQLVFRWYKLSSDGKPDQWIDALLRRRPPPIAIISGNSSDLARDVARALRDQTRAHADVAPPLLLLTAATADRVRESDDSSDDVPLSAIHVQRTFRFCFTNRQMAQAVVDFIWRRDELRPDSEPIYVASWGDDVYSTDLSERFVEVASPLLVARSAAQQWMFLAGTSATGGFLFDTSILGNGPLANPVGGYVDYSVGLVDQPNRWEGPVVRRMMEMKTDFYPTQRRPLLILPAGSSQTMRRFLRGLDRASEKDARRFVVATGDGISFNTVYRDRNIAWPIQDLPFNLVFFCHRDPMDAEAGFLPAGASPDWPPDRGSRTTGTEDLLLNMDIVETLTQAAYQAWPANGDELAERLSQARWRDGRVIFGADGEALFDPQGNRRSGTGEHLVWLRPTPPHERSADQARIEVWTPDGNRAHEPVAVSYENATRSSGRE
jgi:hypothetical protein